VTDEYESAVLAYLCDILPRAKKLGPKAEIEFLANEAKAQIEIMRAEPSLDNDVCRLAIRKFANLQAVVKIFEGKRRAA